MNQSEAKLSAKIILSVVNYLVISSIIIRFGFNPLCRLIPKAFRLFYILCDDEYSQQDKIKARADFIFSVIVLMFVMLLPASFWWIGLAILLIRQLLLATKQNPLNGHLYKTLPICHLDDTILLNTTQRKCYNLWHGLCSGSFCTTTCPRHFCPSDGVAVFSILFSMKKKKQLKTGKMCVDITVAVITTLISLVSPYVGLLISLAWAALPFFKESATQLEREKGCKDVIFTVLTAMISNPIVNFFVQMGWILLLDIGE